MTNEHERTVEQSVANAWSRRPWDAHAAVTATDGSDILAEMSRAWLLLLTLSWSTPVYADIAPNPKRPMHWEDQPAPMPEPPPEKDPLPVLLLGLAALTWAMTRQRSATEKFA